MTNPTTAAASGQPRRLGRSVLAVFLGFVTVVVLSLGTDQILHVLKVYPPWGQPMYEPGLNLLALSYRIVYTVLGMYITANYAPYSAMRHVWVAGSIGLVFGIVGVIAGNPVEPGSNLVPDRDRAHCLAMCLVGRSSIPRETP